MLGQETQGLKAERSKFKDLMHDAKWTAAQAAGPDQDSVTSPLFSRFSYVQVSLLHSAYSRTSNMETAITSWGHDWQGHLTAVHATLLLYAEN